MSGLHADTGWTHLALGLVLGGIGSGLANPPLASTAVGVVHHHQAGMASGANTTFRQIGIAVGVAAYGSISTTGHGALGAGPAAFVDGLNRLLLTSGGVALVGGVLAVLLIRQRDFVAQH
ncbi:hypothetical protein [Nocardioides sp.]|uniref:hypothetical protein n=1 Tax=Nocardioides sp. TaxID=35761 RepID=UPI0039E4E6EB